MFKWLSSDRPAPEALELEEKQRTLEAVEERYAEVYTEYATLQNELAAFKLRYWRRVGPLYARLDAVRAEIAAELARNAPRNPARQQAARAAGAQARASADSLHEAEEDANSEAFEVNDDLKRLYRQAARLVHPDRADDDEDRSLRDEIMARINAAYRNGNGLVIESLIEEYQQRAEVGEEDAATRLIRTIRTIARMRDQIRETEAAILTLRDSELVRLQKIVIEAEARGVDKLAELAAGVERQIAEAEVRLERIRKYAAAAATVTLEPVPSARTAQRTVAEKKVEEGLVDPPAAGSPVAQTFRSARGEELERAAELYIADQLHAAGQDYAYRQPCVLAAGQCLRVPDFTVLDAESKPLLWFHQPEMDAEAREGWQADLAAYAALGFETGINLFVTRDDETGAVDETRLRKMVLFVLSLARS